MPDYLSFGVGSNHHSDRTGFDFRIFLSELLLGV